MVRIAVFFLLLAQLGFADPKDLKIADIKPTLQEMFSYHVEVHDLNPQMVKRSLKIYLDQFDPEKIYLLKNEVIPYLDLNDEQIGRIIQKLRVEDFSDYAALSALVDRSMVRSHRLRQEIIEQLCSQKELQLSESVSHFAGDERELRERIKNHLIRFYFLEKSKVDNSDARKKIFALHEKRIARLESPYLLKNSRKEHFFSMHLLKAFAKSLDAHTTFFTPEEAYEMRTGLEKQFEGIGVILKEGVDGVEIVDLIKGGPAEKCGKIASGDLLIAIDGSPILDASYEEVLKKMKGNGKKQIALGLRRSKEDKSFDFRVDLTREKIMLLDERLQYSSEPFGNGIIAKLTLPSFYEGSDASSCERDIREAIRELKKRGEILGLVLDLRHNSGGFLKQAVKVAGLFITNGVIVISKYAQGEVQYLRELDARVYYNGPLVILTSKASASAAEIVAQALQDYGVALIVGDERTYGKGTIQYQTVTDEDAKAFFKVTVGKYYTVSGRSAQIEGVKADLLVPTEYAPYNIGERYLEYPLPNDQVAAVYLDPLVDIDQRNKYWFQNNYLPTLQKQEMRYRRLLPILKTNSEYRLSHDPNLKAFVKSQTDSTAPKNNWGIADLQMGEAINILKDMTLSSSEK